MQYKNINDVYLELVLYSFNKMKSTLIRGYSWKAFTIWKNEWERIKPSNKTKIKDFLCEKHEEQALKNIDDVKKIIKDF